MDAVAAVAAAAAVAAVAAVVVAAAPSDLHKIDFDSEIVNIGIAEHMAVDIVDHIAVLDDHSLDFVDNIGFGYFRPKRRRMLQGHRLMLTYGLDCHMVLKCLHLMLNSSFDFRLLHFDHLKIVRISLALCKTNKIGLIWR